jgi:hypothetical protein
LPLARTACSIRATVKRSTAAARRWAKSVTSGLMSELGSFLRGLGMAQDITKTLIAMRKNNAI